MSAFVPLPPVFLQHPIAHRALHDRAAGRPENSRAAIGFACEHGYGIEVDLQLSRDGQAIVFHDYDLERLTGAKGKIQSKTAEEISELTLLGGDDGPPTFAELLDLVEGRVPLLVEFKDQDGALGPGEGILEQAVADTVAGYPGPIAFMSFNPHSVARMADLAPDIPRGLTTEMFIQEDWPNVPAARLSELTKISDFDRVGAGFISHAAKDLDMDIVLDLKTRGIPILCWTIRSPEAEARARKIADNVTFEGYLPG